MPSHGVLFGRNVSMPRDRRDLSIDRINDRESWFDQVVKDEINALGMSTRLLGILSVHGIFITLVIHHTRIITLKNTILDKHIQLFLYQPGGSMES